MTEIGTLGERTCLPGQLARANQQLLELRRGERRVGECRDNKSGAPFEGPGSPGAHLQLVRRDPANRPYRCRASVEPIGPLT
jgi:hypothetical protein